MITHRDSTDYYVPCGLLHYIPIRDCSDVIGAVESVKAASDVYAPVSGTVVASNDTLSENPGMVNESAEDNAWFCTLE